MKVYTTFILSASITRGVTYAKLTHSVARGRYSQHTKSNTAYTEALYDSLNELEEHFQSYILGCVETLLQSNHLKNFRPRKARAGITLMIANFLRVAPQRINLPQLISEAFPDGDRILPLCIINNGARPSKR